MGSYLFTSQRLGFRNWHESDVATMAAINADAAVMEFFPSTQTLQQTRDFIERMQGQFTDKHYCYFAVDTLADGEFIGFIGLSDKAFEASFTPCIDIGWRLVRTAWGKGYATEGAQRCLQYGFAELGMDKIYSMAPKVNLKSEHVMKKIGMKKAGEFIHPLLTNNERLKDCVLYEILK